MNVNLEHGDLHFAQEDLGKLDRWLERFAEYRSNEEQYLENERTYKVNLFNCLSTIWDKRHSDPDESRDILDSCVRTEWMTH